MAGENHQSATVQMIPEGRPEGADPGIIQGRGRFVEDPQRRITEHHPRQGRTLLLAGGQGSTRPFVPPLDADGRKGFTDTTPIGTPAMQRPQDIQIFPGGQFSLQGRPVPQVTDLGPVFGCGLPDVRTVPEDAAGFSQRQAAQDAQERCLAAPVRPPDLQSHTGFHRQ